MSLKIRVKAVTKTFLNVGMGPSVDLKVDVPFSRIIKRDEEFLYILGSSIKGVLRKNAYTIFHKINGATKLHVRKLFGESGTTPGKLWVRSAKLCVNEDNLIVLSRIRIALKSNRATEKALFTEEVITPLTPLEFEVELYSDDPLDLKLTLYSIRELNYQKFGRGGALEIQCVEISGKTSSNINNTLIELGLKDCRGVEEDGCNSIRVRD